MTDRTVTVGDREIPIVKPKYDVTLASRQQGGKHYRRPPTPIIRSNWMAFSVMSMRKRTVEPVHFISPVVLIDRSAEGWMRYTGQKSATISLRTPTEYLAMAGWLSSQVYADVIEVEGQGTYNFFTTNDYMSSALSPIRSITIAASSYLFGMDSAFMGSKLTSRQTPINKPETFLEYA